MINTFNENLIYPCNIGYKKYKENVIFYLKSALEYVEQDKWDEVKSSAMQATLWAGTTKCNYDLMMKLKEKQK